MDRYDTSNVLKLSKLLQKVEKMKTTQKKERGFEFWAQLNDMEKIKQYIKKLGFICLSDSLSTNKIYQKNENIITINNNV